jgi:hypothetical protein
MAMFPEFRLGVEKPENEPKSIDEMRQSIERASHESALVRSALMSARYQGLSGEDTYAMLAYHALRELERLHKMNLKWLSLTPQPSTLLNILDHG